jgi:hypothetical protein
MSAILDQVWNFVLAYWHAVPAQAKATLIAATVSALVVVHQIGRQARNALKQSRHNEALKLKLEIYKDIIGITRDASNAISDLSSFARNFPMNLSFAQQTQAKTGNFAVPSAHPSHLIEKKSELYSTHIKMIAITETWKIVDNRIDVFRTAINSALYDIDEAYRLFFDAALPLMNLGGSGAPWTPPSAETIQQIGALGNSLIDTLMTLQSYIFDFQSEMQTLLVGELFGRTVRPRAPIDPESVVVQLDRHDELSR